MGEGRAGGRAGGGRLWPRPDRDFSSMCEPVEFARPVSCPFDAPQIAGPSASWRVAAVACGFALSSSVAVLWSACA